MRHRANRYNGFDFGEVHGKFPGIGRTAHGQLLFETDSPITTLAWVRVYNLRFGGDNAKYRIAWACPINRVQ